MLQLDYEIENYIGSRFKLILYTATIQDEVLLAKANGKSEDEIKDLEHLNDLLLPIVKGYGSERAWTLLGTESLQTFGGSGFTQDWPLEQYVRDAKIPQSVIVVRICLGLM